MRPGAPPPPRPERVRATPRSFGWIDHRLLRDAHLSWLSPAESALYLFLALAADHRGVSWYRLERISEELGYMDWGDLARARRRLVEFGLIAYHERSAPNGVYQVLPLDGLASRREQRGAR